MFERIFVSHRWIMNVTATGGPSAKSLSRAADLDYTDTTLNYGYENTGCKPHDSIRGKKADQG